MEIYAEAAGARDHGPHAPRRARADPGHVESPRRAVVCANVSARSTFRAFAL
jgi:hypothetical protein